MLVLLGKWKVKFYSASLENSRGAGDAVHTLPPPIVSLANVEEPIFIANCLAFLKLAAK